ncbi:interferon-induced protein 44-like [Pempheris klunzingeri]|uniref:interferon-induced protein 44-like n=1 Tax=Pempheris klunzingeri TaxID=3127111 RepID=UPI0039814132
MGSGKSKPEPPPLLSKPWREIDWRDKQRALQSVRNYQPQTEDLQIRILLHGLSGAGKSSFINSVQSVLHDRMYTHALADNMTQDTFTKKYITYKIPKGPGTFYPFVFNDIMGLHSMDGVLVDDIKLALKGHVKEGYTFNPTSKLSEDNLYYKRAPTANDKVHVLVCVVSAAISELPDDTLKMIRDIRKEASDLGIPQVAVLTKIDKACPEIKEDVKNVYKVDYLKKKMEEFSAAVGIPMNCIFPVKNYSEEIDLNSDVDSLILSAMKHIINYGEDYIRFKAYHSELLG